MSLHLKNVSAHTDPGAEYPAYYSLNQLAGGGNELTVRSPGKQGTQQAAVVLSDAHLEKLAQDILDHLADKARGR